MGRMEMEIDATHVDSCGRLLGPACWATSRAVETEEHDDHVIFPLRKFRPFIDRSCEVHRPYTEIWEVPLFRRGSKLYHGMFIAVHRIDLKAVRGEIERVASRPGRDVERLAFR